MKKVIAILLCFAMMAALLAGCGAKGNEKPLVAGYSNFSSKFSPFFSETAYDQDVWALTSVNLLDIDRLGAIVEKLRCVKPETVLDALKHTISARKANLLDLNVKAVEAGRRFISASA